METISLIKENALTAYKNAKGEIKDALGTLLGIGTVYLKITDRVKTIEDALEIVPRIDDPIILMLLNYNGTNKQVLAHKMREELGIICQALNEGWEADWNDGDQKKWTPIFKWNGSGVGFSGSFFVYSYAYADSGSRLRLKNEELSNYVGKQFEAKFKILLLN